MRGLFAYDSICLVPRYGKYWYKIIAHVETVQNYETHAGNPIG